VAWIFILACVAFAVTRYRLRACAVLLVLGRGRRCVWASLYLDRFGEEDRDLRRGKVLTLSRARVAQLTAIVRNLGFVHDTVVLSRTVRVANGISDV